MERKKRVTIYDVARHAGVTTATVSRVLNGKAGISPATRERVSAVVRRMHYFPSPAASGLRAKATREIGILSPFFIGDFFLKIFESLHRRLKDYDLILYNAQTPAHRREVIDRVVAEEKLCALIVASTPVLLEEEIRIMALRIPVILVEARHHSFSSVDYDHQIGAFKAVSHLVELGHRDIAIVGGRPETRLYSPIGKERLSGYRMALAMAGIAEREQYVTSGEWSSADARACAEKLLSGNSPPTAIFATSDVQAAGVLMAARDLGVRVPQDLSVVGYDNMPLAEYLSLTTMWQHDDLLARNAATLLLEELRTGVRTGERVVLQPELVVRSSTQAPTVRRSA
jgi:LacI family transcriptional regulator, galactose operon repressor